MSSCTTALSSEPSPPLSSYLVSFSSTSSSSVVEVVEWCFYARWLAWASVAVYCEACRRYMTGLLWVRGVNAVWHNIPSWSSGGIGSERGKLVVWYGVCVNGSKDYCVSVCVCVGGVDEAENRSIGGARATLYMNILVQTT